MRHFSHLQVRQVTPLSSGLLVEQQVTGELNGLPTLFTLLHPMGGLCPVLLSKPASMLVINLEMKTFQYFFMCKYTLYIFSHLQCASARVLHRSSTARCWQLSAWWLLSPPLPHLFWHTLCLGGQTSKARSMYFTTADILERRVEYLLLNSRELVLALNIIGANSTDGTVTGGLYYS